MEMMKTIMIIKWIKINENKLMKKDQSHGEDIDDDDDRNKNKMIKKIILCCDKEPDEHDGNNKE